MGILLIAGLYYPSIGLAQLTRLDTTSIIFPTDTGTVTDPPPTTDPGDTGSTSTGMFPTDPNAPTDTPPADPTRPTETPLPGTPGLFVPGTPAGTFTPRPPFNPNFPPEETPPPAQECPIVDPTLENPTPVCPTATTVPIIPQVPYLVLGTPFLAVILLWTVLSYMGKRQRAVEERYVTRHLQNQHAQNVNQTRQKIYRKFVDFLSSSNTSDRPLNNQALEQYMSKLALLGSPKVNELGEKVQTAFLNNDHTALKPLLKDLAAQIKLEL